MLKTLIKWLCCIIGIHVHEWGKWGSEFQFGFELYQRKECLKCGKKKTRSAGWAENDY